MVDWTAERIAEMSSQDIKTLRQNAQRLGNDMVVALCDKALSVRFPARPKTAEKIRRSAAVTGFHFVCPKEAGVTPNSDGTVWTGTWVVDPRHAERGSRIGAYVALHAAKSEPSYLQGTIKDWRRSPRDAYYADGRPAKTRYGIDFLLEVTGSPYEWQGDGSGEKGYAYIKPGNTTS